MDTLESFEFKQRKYMPVFPRAKGKPTSFIEGYPCEDDEPMAATGFHGEQINTLSDQLSRYFEMDAYIHIGIDSFIYYREGDITKVVAPDIFVVLGVAKYPLRRSFYTWSEGAVPTTVFGFLSDATANHDRNEKVQTYMTDMGVAEYFIHQPEMKKPPEFRGWRRNPSGGVEEIAPDERGGLFSEALNLWLRWEDRLTTHTRLLRPYLPDGTPITTSSEEQRHRKRSDLRAEEALERERQELRRRRNAERSARDEADRRRDAERLARVEAARRREEAERRREAEIRAGEESERRRDAEAEVKRLRAQLASRRGDSA